MRASVSQYGSSELSADAGDGAPRADVTVVISMRATRGPAPTASRCRSSAGDTRPGR